MKKAVWSWNTRKVFNLDIAHLSERSRELNERVRKIEAEQLELEAIMNEAVGKVPLAAEADYSAEGTRI